MKNEDEEWRGSGESVFFFPWFNDMLFDVKYKSQNNISHAQSSKGSEKARFERE